MLSDKKIPKNLKGGDCTPKEITAKALDREESQPDVADVCCEMVRLNCFG